jgi:VWFA-related protein
MRACVFGALGLALLLVVPAEAQGERRQKYQIELLDKILGPYEKDGKLVYTARFEVKPVGEASLAEEGPEFLVIEENNKEVHREELQAPTRDLTAILAMDVSGSMARKSKSGQTKMAEAQAAARTFLDKLHAKADTGLILFDHTIKLSLSPALDRARIPEHRRHIGEEIGRAVPAGGTAYLDACYEALQRLKGVPGNRVIVLMTDGVDMDSKRKKTEVVALARALHIPIYVLGVGDPGWEEPVSTVLVLDHSKSMEARAGDADDKTKIQALHHAASRFVDLMRPTAQATLLPFSSEVEKPEEFIKDKTILKKRIRTLVPSGGTSLYDATFAGIETVVASGQPGKRYVVVLTDGIDEDPGSRHDPNEVIERAREAGVAVYMLGLGRKEEINETVMRQIAERTEGKYFHAENQKRLFEIFESLSLDIHGDGIDEAALRSLAEQTKGKYYPASDASKLRDIYVEIAEELQSKYKRTFTSNNQKKDGTVSAIDISIVDKYGNILSNRGMEDVARPGLIVPEIDYRVYLILLGLLVGLLYLPSGLKRLQGAPRSP